MDESGISELTPSERELDATYQYILTGLAKKKERLERELESVNQQIEAFTKQKGL
jgi:hypothetical protein